MKNQYLQIKQQIKKTPQNNPPIIKEQESKPIDFSKNPELEEKCDFEKAEIKNETEQKLALVTTGQIQSVILTMDKSWIKKWDFNESNFIENTQKKS